MHFMLREEPCTISPCKEIRTSSDRQPHSTTDEVIDGSLCRGTIEHLILKASNHQPQRPMYLERYSKPHVIEKKKSARAASNASW
jgi:hypothetical protein